jgi:16S rRNA (guanine966-N2)-methyltransferase
MSIKILGGTARGYSLAVPKTFSTRPTSVMIRRKLFDWRQGLEGFTFIDLCAGSGAMGFEALSRGAVKVCLNDNNRQAFVTLKKNAETFLPAFRMGKDVVHITAHEAEKWITHELNYQLTAPEDTIIYIDPPYSEHALYFKIIDALKAAGYPGEVWIESDKMTGPKMETITGAVGSVIKTVESGDHFVVVGKLV